ncbi:TonB-dependent receptor [bacterium]|nr:TonB-dependent receptor [bacterium]MBU1434906.1 TonB-dependent receptor [bacterium]MBU1504011.1 TonB-dependent receptor [bacterium]
MKKIFLMLSTTCLLFANDDMHLLEDLKDASEIATRTKLNMDKTPSVVSVLHADELKKLGMINLYEALESVPGIEISMGTAGAKQINMRGNKSIIRDKIKLMIDGMSVNSELAGTSYFYLDMPLELIERIEIIRGPASTLYGSFAHIGVINVITKSSTHEEGLFFTKMNSKNFKDVGFTQHLNTEKMKIALDGFFQDNKSSRSYGSYSLIPGQEFTSYENFTNKSLGLNIFDGENISLQARWLKVDTQNYFGYGNWPISKDPKALQTTSFVSEFLYTPKLSNDLSMDFKVGYKQYEYEGDARYVPYSLLPTPTYPPYDLIGGGYYKEQGVYTDAAFKYSTANHKILFGALLSYAKEADTNYFKNDPTLGETLSIPVENIKKDISREQYALYLNDIYSFSDAWTLNLGGRYDYYSDADSSLVPKIALLYNYDELQSYKLIYQRSFRAPAWVELYGKDIPYFGEPSLKSETIDTIELAYRYQPRLDNWMTLNLYYSEMQDFINRNAAFAFFNDKDIRSYGAEFEAKATFNTTTFQGNYSYIHIEDEAGRALPFVATHLANLMLSKKFNRNWQTGAKLRYVGEKKRELADTRENLDAYVTYDHSLTYSYEACTFGVSVKNLFDKNIAYPSQLGTFPSSGTYMDDFPRDGRTFWLSLEWRIP